MIGTNVTNFKFIGRRDMNMDPNIKALFDESDEYYYPYFNDAKELLWLNLNSHVPQQKTYPSFGTDLAHVIDSTESLIIGNKNVDQNFQLEWEIFFYQWTVWA